MYYFAKGQLAEIIVAADNFSSIHPYADIHGSICQAFQSQDVRGELLLVT